MAEASSLYVNGQKLLMKDGEARAKGEAALEMAALLRSQSIDQFGGRSLAVQFANEILNFDDEWAWLQDRVKEGKFDGLMIGDYLDVTLTSGFQMRYRIGAIDPYYRVGDSANVMGHNIAMVPDETVPVTGSFATNGDHIMWNTTNTNQGTAAEKSPYLVSNLHKWEEDVFKALLPKIVRDRILPRRVLLEERYSAAGAQANPTGWAWKTVNIWSLSEIEVYGHPLWATNGYAMGSDSHFPLFAQWKDRIRDATGTRVNWWLRVPSASSSTNACIVNGYGIGHANAATNPWQRPLPCFLIG